MAGFDNDIVYGTNCDFTGTSPVSGQINLNGELLVGAAVAPFIRSYVPTGSNGLVVNTGPGTLDLTLVSIPNSALQNSSINVIAGTGLTGGGVVSLGGSVTLDAGIPPITQGNRVLIQSQTVAGSSAVQFTSGFTGFDLYEIDVYSLNTSGGNGLIYFQLSTDNGGTWISADYNLSAWLVTESGGTAAFSASAAAQGSLATNQNDSSTSPMACYIKISSMNSSSLYKGITFLTLANDGSGAATINGTCVLNNTTACNAIQIYPGTGTFSTGIFNLYGISNGSSITPTTTYSSGTYLPVAKGSGGDPSVVYASQVGNYVLIGKLCYVTMFLNWAGGNYTGGAGNAGFTLPFPADATTDNQQAFVFVSGNGRGEGYCASVAPGESVAYVGDAGGLISTGTQAGLGSNNISGCYIIA